MKVYTVESGEYLERMVDGIFSTRERAERYAEKLRKVKGRGEIVEVEEWELDQNCERQVVTVWTVRINLATGEITHYRTYHDFEDSPEPPQDPVQYGPDGPVTFLSSRQSVSHATEQAVEFRQKWLRGILPAKVAHKKPGPSEERAG